MTNKTRIFLAIFLIGIDQLSKLLVLKSFTSIATVNKVGAFSVSLGKIDYALFALMALVAFVLLVRFFDKKVMFGYGFIFLLSGGIANIVDRFAFGGVVDFFASKYWPTFNLADVFITVGAVLILIDLIQGTRHLRA